MEELQPKTGRYEVVKYFQQNVTPLRSGQKFATKTCKIIFKKNEFISSLNQGSMEQGFKLSLNFFSIC